MEELAGGLGGLPAHVGKMETKFKMQAKGLDRMHRRAYKVQAVQGLRVTRQVWMRFLAAKSTLLLVTSSVVSACCALHTLFWGVAGSTCKQQATCVAALTTRRLSGLLQKEIFSGREFCKVS